MRNPAVGPCLWGQMGRSNVGHGVLHREFDDQPVDNRPNQQSPTGVDRAAARATEASDRLARSGQALVNSAQE